MQSQRHSYVWCIVIQSRMLGRGDSLNHAKKPRNAKSASVIIIGSDSDDDEVTSPSKKPAAKDLQTRARLCDMPAPCQTKREENLSDKDDFEVCFLDATPNSLLVSICIPIRQKSGSMEIN